MCRLLGIQAAQPVDVVPWLEAFAVSCRASKEFQGHGWGVSWWTGDGWERYRSMRPIWEDTIEVPETSIALVHARSAFRNEGIVVENNMPFLGGDLAFAFNGELREVRLSVPGETGAARLFHLLDRFTRAADGDVLAALSRLDQLIATRTDYVRALNVLVSDGRSIFVNTRYSEDPEYFTLHTASIPGSARTTLISSEVIATVDVSPEWNSLPNLTTRALVEMAC